MGRWQLKEHVSYINDILPCPDRCYLTMTTDGAWLIHEWYITMLWLLSWAEDNWRSMFHTWGIYHLTLTFIMRRWQQTDHVSYTNYILLCPDRCHETMTTDGAWFIHKWYTTMLFMLSLDDDNWLSIFHTLGMHNHALSSWDDDNWQSMFHIWGIYYHLSFMYETFSVRYHRLMTTVRAW